MKTVAELMRKKPVYLGPEATIEQAWLLMRKERVRHVPICKGLRVVGLITQKDLLVNAQNSALLSLPVAEIMVYNVKTIPPDTSLKDAARIMLDERISCLPVVADDELKGILTETDFLEALIGLL